MRLERILLIICALAVAILGVQLVQSHRSLRRAGEESAALRLEVEEARQRSAESKRMSRQLESELQRLRTEHEELLRLRGEVGSLRRQLEAASRAKPVALSPQQPAPVETAVEPTPSYTNFSSTVETLMEEGDVLITGGWPTGDGRRTLALVTPTLNSSGRGNGQIVIRAKFIEAPEALMRDSGLELPSGAENPGLLAREEDLTAFLQRLSSSEGVNVLSAPEVVTLSGRQAQIAITETATLPNGEQVTTGPVLEAVAESTQAPGQISLKITASVGLVR